MQPSLRTALPLLVAGFFACEPPSETDLAENTATLESPALEAEARTSSSGLSVRTEVKEGGTELLDITEGGVHHKVIRLDLSKGAQLFSYTTPRTGMPDNPGPFPMVGPNPNFERWDLERFWNLLSRNRVFVMVNGAWFDPKRQATPSPFTIKEEGVVLSAGHNMVSEFVNSGHILLLRINNSRQYADIVDYEPARYAAQLADFDTILGGLEEAAPDKIPVTYTGRTMVGVKGSVVMIFTSPWSTAANPRVGNGGADYLKKLGALRVIMLGGGDSAQARGVNVDQTTGLKQISTYVRPGRPVALPNVLYVLSTTR